MAPASLPSGGGHIRKPGVSWGGQQPFAVLPGLACAVEIPEPGAGLAGEPALWANADLPAGAVTCPATCP